MVAEVAIPILLFSGILLFVTLIVSSVHKSEKKSESNYKPSYKKPSKQKVRDYTDVENTCVLKMPTSIDGKKHNFKTSKLVFKSIWRILKTISEFPEHQISYIIEDGEDLKSHLVVKKLKRMPIENINIFSSRINISTLKQHGFRNINDLLKIEGLDYTYFNGIGQVTSDKIRYNLETIIKETARTTPVKFSFDDKDSYSSALVLTIAIYLGTIKYANLASELLTLEPIITKHLKQISRLIRNPLFLFKTKSAVQKIETIYAEVYKLYEENLSNIDQDLVAPFNRKKNISNEEAWDYYSKHVIDFNKVLDKYVRGVELQNLAEYGLPQSVAKKVKEITLNLDGFKLGLRTYQEWGTKYILCQKKTILGDEMGLGKTVQAIAAIVDLKNKGATHFMVVCPLSVLTNWCREIYKFCSIPYFRLYSDGLKYRFNQWKEKGGIAVTTYETLKKLPTSDLSINLLVVDEAHFIKNPTAQRTNHTIRFMRVSQNITFLTGTPLENRVNEMIELIGHLRPNLSAELDTVNKEISSEGFRQKVSQVYFRRRRADVLSELPEKTEIEDWCDLNEKEQMDYRDSIMNHSFAKARQVSWNVDGKDSTKMNRLKEIIELAKEDGRKVLVFSFFLNTISKIVNELGSIAYGPITGSISSETRQQIIDKFDNAPAGSVLVSQIQAGGIGLNIQSASVVVICEPQFKPSVENQAISRSYRMGQARKVLVYRLLATNTIDERLNEVLLLKQKEFNTYADTSVVAEQSFQIDEHMFSGIMNDEYRRLSNNQTLVEHIEPVDIEKPIEQLPETNNQKRDFIPSRKGGVSVTVRIKEVQQPWGGYIHPKDFETTKLPINVELGEENISPSLVGIVVDYLSRYMNGASKEEAFRISLLGAGCVDCLNSAKVYLNRINRELDDNSIVSAIRLAGFDVAFRAGPSHFKSVETIQPDEQTISNVREMANRSMEFFKEFGPVVSDGFTFEGGGYTDTISSGDGDYLTKDTLWDFKVIKKDITSAHTLQLLVYYLMGIHSGKEEFKSIRYLGIYNPRKHEVYRYDLNKLLESIKHEVEELVIGYR